MFRTTFLALILSVVSAMAADHSSIPPGGPNEHAIVLAMFDPAGATQTAIVSGDWSDPKTWADGVPGPGSRVVIPECVTVTVSTELKEDLEWVRVDGSLQFASDRTTGLRLATMVISSTGLLQIGSREHRVHADRTANITFLPRPKGHRDNDPYDLSGGLLSLGQVQIFGGEYRSFAIPNESLNAGVSRLTFNEAPTGWKIGDELLFAASSAGSQDELRKIAGISGDGKSVSLSAPLSLAHVTPAGISSKVPVGNLSRNVVFSSSIPGTLANRAHIMLMTHEGVQISGAAFRGLGRTRTEKVHTVPDRDADGRVLTGDNPIGRYAVHFHLRTGARSDRPANHFVGNAIFDSPKHGLVNHGGNVVAENNVSYAVHGSHFFSENGSEIGAFRDNLAVYSRGSGDKVRSRECLFDFGHGGHGFWAQSAGVAIEGNYAFHHADAAYAIVLLPVKELGVWVKFARRNASQQIQDTIPREICPINSLPFRCVRNVGGNSGKGLELWNGNTLAEHNQPSLIADCQFWETPNAGIDMPYTYNTVIRDTVVQGRPDDRYPGTGVHINTSTRFLTMERVTISGYRTGIEVPVRGHTLIAHCRFDNERNIRISSPVQPNRRTVLRNNSFVRRHDREVDYDLAVPDCSFNGDLSLLFDRDVLLVHDARFPGQTVYFAEQHVEATLNAVTSVEQLRGRTVRDLWEKMGLAIAGSPAPQGATGMSRVRGLVGPVSAEIQRGLEETEAVTFQDDMAKYKQTGNEYTVDQNLDRVRFVKGKAGEPSGWRFETTRDGDRPRTKMTYVDSTKPHFELSSCVKLHIHPDDVKHGIEICGILHDDVTGKPTIKNMIKEFKDLKIDADGFATVNYCCSDAVGNQTEHTFRFEVTEEAPRRGKNIAYYNQKEYMPPEEPVVEERSSRRSWRWAWLSGLMLALCLAGFGGRMAWNRRTVANR